MVQKTKILQEYRLADASGNITEAHGIENKFFKGCQLFCYSQASINNQIIKNSSHILHGPHLDRENLTEHLDVVMRSPFLIFIIVSLTLYVLLFLDVAKLSICKF